MTAEAPSHVIFSHKEDPCSSTKKIIASIDRRAPPSRNMQTLRAASHWPAASHAPEPSSSRSFRLGDRTGNRRPLPSSSPIHCASTLCSRSWRLSRKSVTIARSIRLGDPKPSKTLWRGLPVRICFLPCSNRLHFLRSRSLRRTRCGSEWNFRRFDAARIAAPDIPETSDPNRIPIFT